MDANTLLLCFAGTLEVLQAVREHAEAELRQLSRKPGFLGACLDIIAEPNAPAGCRKAAAVYFKNRVTRDWMLPEGIDQGEKPVVLDRLVPLLAAVDFATKHQLAPVFRVLVAAEYPDRWPQLLPAVGALLQKQHDVLHMFTGVMCFAEICRYYRWSENAERSAHLDPIISQVFPHLLAVGHAILAAELTEATADILKHILKAYKFVVNYDLPAVLQTREALSAWGEFHYHVIATKPPAYILSALALDLEKLQTQIAKVYKWLVANVETLFRRYASRDLLARRKYDAFRDMFVGDFLPHLVPTYLTLLEQWSRGERWLPNTALYHLFEFLSQCTAQKDTWHYLRLCFADIVAHFIFPILCPLEDTLELFESDPADYINSKLDNFDVLEPDIAALGLLVTLVTKRKKTTLEPILAFACAQLDALNAQPEDMAVARKKDGALRLVGGISHKLTAANSPYLAQMERFFALYVLPNLDSKHEFLQARALDVCLRFSDLAIENDHILSTLYNGILRPFTSDAPASLPVSLQSALAIQAYLHRPQFAEILGAIVLPTMAKLLELSNEIDNESVSAVMQELVENFSQQLQPFGVDLMKNLVDQFLRLAGEILEAESTEPDDYDADASDAITDKLTAALGLLNTMITVLLSFENSTEICIKLEETFSPVIEFVLSKGLDDFVAEVGELIENLIFSVRSVSPLMWSHFSRLADAFSLGIALMYTEELAPALKNYMVFGSEFLAQSPELVHKLMNIILLVIEGEDGMVDYNDITLACGLAQTLVLSLQHNLPPFIAALSHKLVPVLSLNQKDAAHVKDDALMVNLVNYVTACLMYDWSGTLKVLQENQFLTQYFDEWMALIPQLKRVYDIKLSILGLLSLARFPEALQMVPAATLGLKLAVLFKALPAALKNLEKQRAEFSAADFMGDYGDAEYPSDYGSDYEDDQAESTEKYMEFLQQENSRFVGSSLEVEEPVFEDVLGSTPLDSVDPVAVFGDFSSSLQSGNPQMYQALFGSLTADEQQVFIGMLEKS